MFEFSIQPLSIVFLRFIVPIHLWFITNKSLLKNLSLILKANKKYTIYCHQTQNNNMSLM